MSIQAFLFDCGGVLLRDGDDAPYRAWEERLGLPAGELRRRLWEGDTWSLAERGRITDEEFWARSGSALGLGAPEDLARLREDLWGAWRPEPGVLEIVDRLRRTHRVAILSNASDALEGMLAERYGVADRFEAILNSARLGVAKPERAIYERALAALGLEPRETVFIDDRAENIAAAAALGLHVVWYVGPAELARQLAAYLPAEAP
jgi:HAD superfamily hydrolase (TIGR01509 family)